MGFDDFLKYCTFDLIPADNNDVKVEVIFSSGFIKKFSKDFVDSNLEVAKKLTAADLYDCMNHEGVI